MKPKTQTREPKPDAKLLALYRWPSVEILGAIGQLLNTLRGLGAITDGELRPLFTRIDKLTSALKGKK